MVYLPTFTIQYHKNQPNVGKYTIHGWYGLVVDHENSQVSLYSQCHCFGELRGVSWKHSLKQTAKMMSFGQIFFVRRESSQDDGKIQG